MAERVSVQLGSWDELREPAARIRHTVFVDEQQVPAEVEIDHWDPQCVHALARTAGGEAVGTGRLLPDGHIGRMAVLASARGLGVGSALLIALMSAAYRRGDREVILSAQTHAVPFYRHHGFVEEGAVYDDCNIPHIDMRRRLP